MLTVILSFAVFSVLLNLKNEFLTLFIAFPFSSFLESHLSGKIHHLSTYFSVFCIRPFILIIMVILKTLSANSDIRSPTNPL